MWTPWQFGYRYGHDIIGDLNNGSTGWTDWNILLDETGKFKSGGPNHAGNYCFAPIHITDDGNLNIHMP